MCGIAGIVGSRRKRWPVAATMLRLLAHRGPDDLGWAALRGQTLEIGRGLEDEVEGETVLMHRRLSILDLSDAGHQPMRSADGRLCIVFNGEIYNFIELREELERKGRVFRSHSDTEVLLQSYAEWGEACLTKLVGMFAFAALDIERRTLFMARDFFGIKPLYYAQSGEHLVFGSEIKGLLACPDVGRELDAGRVYDYLRHGKTDESEQTLFAKVRQLPAGHCARVDLDKPGSFQIKQYWKPTLLERGDISFEEAARSVRDIFLRNISLHLRSDVPVGAALSGGIDSSAIVCGMRQVAGKSLDLHTFSFIPDNPELSEEKWVDQVNGATGAQAHKIRLSPSQLTSDLEELIRSHDEPFGSTSMYAQFAVFRAARGAGIKVMLDGQGADEIFAGYRSYLPARLASLLRQGRLVQAKRFLGAASRLPGMSAKWLVVQAGRYLTPRIAHESARALFGKESFPAWMNRGWFVERGVGLLSAPLLEGGGILKAYLAKTLTEINLPHLLRYEDRNSMAFSVESRVPFLTPELVNFVYSLPEEHIIGPEATTKRVLREALRGIVADPILDRRDKIGFATSEKEWMRELAPWAKELIHSDLARSAPVFNHGALAADFDAVMSGRTAYDWRFWRWLNFIKWCGLYEAKFA